LRTRRGGWEEGEREREEREEGMWNQKPERREREGVSEV